MMPSAGGVFLGVVKRRNSMITDAASPAPFASTKANHSSKYLLNSLPPDYAMALGHPLGSGHEYMRQDTFHDRPPRQWLS
jgi:hypothetical protein